jgi:hypothetical protein
MRTTLAVLGILLPTALTAAPSFAQTQSGGRESPPPPIMLETEVNPVIAPPDSVVPHAPATSAAPASAAVPSPTTSVAVAATGQWVYTAELGYLWVPSHTVTQPVGHVPYAFLYTPEVGWAWYASPWGSGAFTNGPWVGRPWALGFHAWIPGPEGWALRSAPPSHAVTGRVFGVAGHTYDPDGREFAGDRQSQSAHQGRMRASNERAASSGRGGSERGSSARGGGHR